MNSDSFGFNYFQVETEELDLNPLVSPTVLNLKTSGSEIHSLRTSVQPSTLT